VAEATKSAPRSEIVACASCGKRNRVPAAADGVPHCGNCQEPLPWLTSAGDDDFDEVVGKASVPVLVDMWAAWCQPCKIVAPGVEAAARKFAGRLKAVKVDVEQAQRTAERFEARGIPLLLLFDHGKEVARQVGAVPPQQLVAWVEDALGKVKAG
jgi:thioredoxin 2